MRVAFTVNWYEITLPFCHAYLISVAQAAAAKDYAKCQRGGAYSIRSKAREHRCHGYVSTLSVSTSGSLMARVQHNAIIAIRLRRHYGERMMRVRRSAMRKSPLLHFDPKLNRNFIDVAYTSNYTVLRVPFQ